MFFVFRQKGLAGEVVDFSAGYTLEMPVRLYSGIEAHFVFFEGNHLGCTASAKQAKRVVNRGA